MLVFQGWNSLYGFGNMEKTDDKRTHKRYEVPEQTFAALNSDPVTLYPEPALPNR